MTIIEVQHIISQGEGVIVEFKEATGGTPNSFYESAVSMSNTDGGVILLGVDDDGVVMGLSTDACKHMLKDIVSTLNTPDCVWPSIYVQPFIASHPKGEILVCQIATSSQVHQYKGDIFVREHDSDIDITDNQLRIGDLYLRKRNFFTESKIYPHLTLDDLDASLFDKARSLIRGYRSDHPWLALDNEELLKSSSLRVKDFQSGEEGLTLAAALIFGKDTTIQAILPAYKVEAMVRVKNQDRWDDRLMPPLRTNLIDTYLELKAFINKHLPEKFYMEGDQRVDLRDKIFREVVANCIVHREYTSAYATELLITKEEVRITNPNRPLFHGFINRNDFAPYPKNPNLRKFFTAFGWTEEIGSGVRNTSRYLPLYSDGAMPSFEEKEIFETRIPLHHFVFKPYVAQLASWLSLPKDCTDHLMEGMANMVIPYRLHEATWEDVLLDLVPSWVEKGTQLPEFLFDKPQRLTKEKMEKVPSWKENSTQLLPKKIRYVVGVLALCTTPISFSQLMDFFQYKNRNTFRDNYLNPLKQLGFIVTTNPDTPNAPDNKYVITELGKDFLMER
ncbi:MAG: putative DNA binding domain-containing protein [Bacteroidales bacterium]|nr:putative DNA binding domain-containing protein [Bacteroidales bacterium]